MQPRAIYLSLISILVGFQLVVTGLLLYVTLHTQAIHYFSQFGSAFSDNPIPLANILTIFEAIDLFIIAVYIYRLKRGKESFNKLFVIIPSAAFMLGLAMLIYLHAGSLGSCMAIPDECGG